jgi:hypothetical protein
MNRKQTWRLRGGAWVMGAALVFLQQSAALACEGCKQAISGANGQETLSAASLGYGWSVSFLLVMMISVVGSLCWMIYRSCQNLERVHAAAEQETSGESEA